MPSKKLITVIGATGQQGGSVVRSLLSSEFSIRGITRDISKPAAQSLASLGVEMVVADINDQASLVKAFADSYGVFALTDYMEKMDAQLEETQGRNIVDAAREVGVKHFVLSTLDDITKVSKGKFANVHHFDSKAHVAAYAAEQGLPLTRFMPGFYMGNIPSLLLRKVSEGHWAFAYPGTLTSGKFPLFDAANDTGLFVRRIFEHPETSIGMRVLGASDYYTAERIIAEFKDTFPRDVKDVQFSRIPDETFKGILASKGMPEFFTQELLENFLILSDERVGYYGGESLEKTRALLGKETPTSWIEFMKAHEAYAGMA